jgi:hypothetical protein
LPGFFTVAHFDGYPTILIQLKRATAARRARGLDRRLVRLRRLGSTGVEPGGDRCPTVAPPVPDAYDDDHSTAEGVPMKKFLVVLILVAIGVAVAQRVRQA